MNNKPKDCQTARGNVRRGLYGDGRRNTLKEEHFNELEDERRKEDYGGYDEVEE